MAANKSPPRTACEWQSGTNKVNPKHLLQIQMWICKGIAVFSSFCAVCNSWHSNAKAVSKEVLTLLLFLLLLLFFIVAHTISVTGMLLCREVKPFERLHNCANSVKEPFLAGVRAGCSQHIKLTQTEPSSSHGREIFGFLGSFLHLPVPLANHAGKLPP